MKAIVACVASHRPDFVELQGRSLRAFLKDKDFDYVVFNNAADESQKLGAIASICAANGFWPVRIEKRDHRTVPYALGQGLTWSFQWAVAQARWDVMLFMDIDMFLMDDFSVESYMSGYDLAGAPQSRLGPGGEAQYLWPGLMFMNLATMPDKATVDLNCGIAKGIGVDSGGMLDTYLTAHPGLKIKKFHHSTMVHDQPVESKRKFGWYFVDAERDKYDTTFGIEMYASRFLHYGRGTNWDRSDADFVRRKTEFVKSLVTRQIKDRNLFRLAEPV